VFQRLHPSLRHAVVNDLGWRSLRPVQELAGAAILDGCNVVVLAPTAGGKTEASLFPVLSDILTNELPPTSALYLCPIRALLNNQEERVQRYTRMVGLEAFKWHGDVAATRKKKFLREPGHILMTTPESLEVMLIGQKAEARAMLANLSVVIVDEIHAFAGDDRGAHLVSLLERVTALTGRDLQRIGLSATVGNPDAILEWLRGSSRREGRLVDPPRPPPDRDLEVDLCDDLEGVALSAAAMTRGRKCLVFVESRGQAERTAAAMADRDSEVFVHHSAVSRADREIAERRLAEGTTGAIVCTSTMELGIDVGDLDLVVQVDAPSTVAGMLQRLGRTGRRPGTRVTGRFLCQTNDTLLQVVALLRLAARGWVEPVTPAHDAAHILAHQVLALALQEGGISPHHLRSWIGSASSYSALAPEAFDDIISTMVSREFLYVSEGRLSLGREGERRFGARNFFDLYAVFDAPSTIRIEHGGREIGAVQARFLRLINDGDGDAVFRLGGRSWRVRGVEWSRGTCEVEPAEHGRVPSWLGLPSALSPDLCRAMRDVLRDDEIPSWLTPVAARQLTAMRAGYEGLVETDTVVAEIHNDNAQIFTFAGGAANRLLAGALEETGLGPWTTGNLMLKSKRPVTSVALDAAWTQLREMDLDALAARRATAATDIQVSKFQDCLPDALAHKLVASRLLDHETSRSVVDLPLRTRTLE
jgi:ATP-dependent Lhr-like helicase